MTYGVEIWGPMVASAAGQMIGGGMGGDSEKTPKHQGDADHQMRLLGFDLTREALDPRAYQYYPGQQLADFNPLQKEGMQGMLNQARDPRLVQGAQDQLLSTLGGDYFSQMPGAPGLEGDYSGMYSSQNPYSFDLNGHLNHMTQQGSQNIGTMLGGHQSIIDAAKGDAIAQATKGLSNQFDILGRSPGSDAEQGVISEAIGKSMASMYNPMQQDYGNAMSQLQQGQQGLIGMAPGMSQRAYEFGEGMAADQFSQAQQRGLQGELGALPYQQTAWNQERDRQMAAAGLAGDVYQDQMMPWEQMYSVGGQYQGQQQALMDIEKEKYEWGRDMPYQRKAGLYGLYQGSAPQQYTQQGQDYRQLGGGLGLMAGSMLSNGFGGGGGGGWNPSINAGNFQGGSSLLSGTRSAWG